MSNPEIPNTPAARHLTHRIAMLKSALTFVAYGSDADVNMRKEIIGAQEALRAECARHAEAVKGPGPLVRTYSRYGMYWR